MIEELLRAYWDGPDGAQISILNRRSRLLLGGDLTMYRHLVWQGICHRFYTEAVVMSPVTGV